MKLTKEEKYSAELVWGGIPLLNGKPDIEYIRNSHLFKYFHKAFYSNNYRCPHYQEGMMRFEELKNYNKSLKTKFWVSMITGNKYFYEEYAFIETPQRGMLPLPKNEYPFTTEY